MTNLWKLRSTSYNAVCSTVNPFGIREISGLSDSVDSNRYKSLGNAVNVFVAEWIGRGIVETEIMLKEKQELTDELCQKTNHVD